MKTIIWTLPPLALAAATCGKVPDSMTVTQPNVVLIVADDLGMGDLSCYGSTTIHTPNIDSLAKGGLLFRNGYASSATSSPSRFALFTGRYPWRSHIKILPGDSRLMIPENMPTMPKMFQDEGYVTGAIGKWHLGMGNGDNDWNTTLVPSANTVGFDYTNLIPATVDRVPTVYVENGKVVGLDPSDPIEVSYEHNFPGEPTAITNPEMMTRQRWSDGHQGTIVNGIPRIGFMKGGKAARWTDENMADYFLSKAKNFVHSNKDKPFFLYYGLHEPHVPRVPADRFVGSTTMGPRGDVIVEADWCVGQIMKELKDNGLLDNTIVIFTSDNGAVVNDGYQDESETKIGKHDPNAGTRGGKYSLYDGGTHIPLIVYWNTRIHPGVTDAYFLQQDLYASFASFFKYPILKTLDSENHLAALFGITDKGRKSQIFEATGRLGLRVGSYVLMPPYDGPQRNATMNELGNLKDYGLFDLSKDRHQDNNLASTKKGKLNRMKKAFMRQVGQQYNPHQAEEKLQ